MRFTRLELTNWRNFAYVNMELQRRVFLIGPNASGKSNFLDAFRFLRDIASEGRGFQKAVLDRGGISKIRCLAARSNSDVSLHVEMRNDEKDLFWTYDLEFNQNDRPNIIKEVVKRGNIEILRRPDENDMDDPERLKWTHLEQVNSNKEFREIVEFFRTIRYSHIVPHLVRFPDRNREKQEENDPFGRDFIEQITATPTEISDSRMKRITGALKIALPQLKELQVYRDNAGTPHLRGLYEHWRPNAGWQTEDQFSDGTLRLFGLLWSILEGNGPILLEEPELSLHPYVIRHIPQIFARLSMESGRQIIVSTHSPDLLSDEGIAPDEAFILTPIYGGAEGTVITRLLDNPELAEQINCGLTVADAAIPETAPKDTFRLSLF